MEDVSGGVDIAHSQCSDTQAKKRRRSTRGVEAGTGNSYCVVKVEMRRGEGDHGARTDNDTREAKRDSTGGGGYRQWAVYFVRSALFRG